MMTVVINGTTGIDTGTGSLIAADATTPTYLDLFEDTDNGSNYVRLIAPTSISANRTLTLPDGTGTFVVNGVNGSLVSGTVNAGGTTPFPSSGGPATVDFTGIPSWVKRITVMFSGVSASGTSPILIQLGTGSTTYTTSGYLGCVAVLASDGSTARTTYTSGFLVTNDSANGYIRHGNIVITNSTGNTWTQTGLLAQSDTLRMSYFGGSIPLAAALTAVRITTVNGTDLFDAGSINILYD
jgi:hypothetical protein